MPSALNLIPHAVDQNRPQIIYATVSATQPLPAHFDDPLYVVEPSRPNVFLIVPSFPAIHGGTLPAAGATCVILRTSPHDPLRCLDWDGAYTTP